MNDKVEQQRLYDRANPEYAQAKGHNQRVKERYPEAWAKSTLTNATLTEWLVTHKGELCAYCNNSAIEIDHKIPLSRSGAHAFENLQMLCLPCNRAKHDLTDEEFRNIRPHIAVEEITQSTGPKFASVAEVTPDALDDVCRLYFQIGDPTEYRTAIELFNSTKYWTELCGLEWFRPHIESWRAQLRAKLKSEAIQRLLAISASATSGALAAIKTLITDDYLYMPYSEYGEVEERRGVGRPPNAPYVEVIPQETLNDDAARIGI